jgi:hypothetical protein
MSIAAVFIDVQAELLVSPDNTDVHGGLLALAELAAAFDQLGLAEEKHKVRAPANQAHMNMTDLYADLCMSRKRTS